MKGFSIALLACVFLALEPVFNKILLQYMSPVVLTALTSSAAAVVLFLILEVEHRVWDVFKLKRKEFTVLLLVGLLSGVFAQLFYATGLRDSTATNAVLLTRLNSLLIAFMGVAFMRERLRMNHVVGAVLMVVGIAVIATRNFTAEVTLMQGDGLLILAAVFWAGSNILMKKYLCRMHPEVIVIYYYGFSGFTLLLISMLMVLTSGHPIVPVTAEVIAYFTGLVVLVSVIGRYLWYYSFERTTASNVGLASLSIPFFGVIYAIVLLSEKMQTHQAVGGILILAGLAAVEYNQIFAPDAEHRLKRHHPHH